MSLVLFTVSDEVHLTAARQEPNLYVATECNYF